MKKYIKSAVMSFKNEPMDIQLEIVRTSDDIDFLAKMIDSASPLGLEIASNPNITDEIADKLWKKYGLISSNAFASNPNTPANILSEIAHRVSQGRVATKVAKNPNTPSDALALLAKSNDLDVNIALATNPNTPIDILQDFAGINNSNGTVYNNKIKFAAMRTLRELGQT
jgi:hypothetical protein